MCTPRVSAKAARTPPSANAEVATTLPDRTCPGSQPSPTMAAKAKHARHTRTLGVPVYQLLQQHQLRQCQLSFERKLARPAQARRNATTWTDMIQRDQPPAPTWVRRRHTQRHGIFCGKPESGDTIGAQALAVFTQAERTLSLRGSDKSRLLMATIYLATRDRAAFTAVWEQWLPKGCAPARVCVSAEMASPDYLLEIAFHRATAGRSRHRLLYWLRRQDDVCTAARAAQKAHLHVCRGTGARHPADTPCGARSALRKHA